MPPTTPPAGSGSTPTQAAASPASAAGSAAATPSTAGVLTAPTVDGTGSEAFDFLPITPAAQGGLTADGAAARIVKVSPGTRISAAEAEVADRRAGRAYSVFVPRVELSASYQRLSPVPLPPGFGQFFNIVLDNYALQGTIRIPVSDYFLTLHKQYDRAYKLAAFSDLQREGQWQQDAYQIRTEYYDLARSIATRQLSMHRVAQLERFAAEVNVLVEGGEVSSVQLAQAKTRLAAAKSQAQAALADQRLKEQILRSRLSLTSGTPLGVAEPLTERLPEAPTDLPALVKRAHKQRPEMRALFQLLEARKDARHVASMERYPTLSANGQVLYAHPNQRFIPPEEEFNASWAVGVELKWSPTDMAIKEDALDSAELEVTRVVEDLRDLYGRIEVEVTGAYHNALAALQSVKSSADAVAAGEEALRVEMALFRAGESTSRAVLDAELELRGAQLQWVDNVLNAHVATAALTHATGEKNY